ncbi:glycosyl hydrolase [Diplogelasinospora grovesii]|uniref:Glycosyl hydrolase n=1 Tax=Diplogelasinospora grovesii TaxID=303347 RepID=A0AAN6MX75_9PEZI|nr:glycosyl hydrolase [Diplogelasinospora grovesii]
MKALLASCLIVLTAATQSVSSAVNSTYTNPILPGWHSDPSCIFVPELGNTTFCTTSTFILFPGIPIYASKDLLNWKLVSNVLNRPTQIPGLAYAPRQRDGHFAATLRYRQGVFYIVVPFVSGYPPNKSVTNHIFSSRNPDPITFPLQTIDPDLFWDDDGQSYVIYPGVEPGFWVATLNLETGEMGNSTEIWPGDGYPYPEGPHMYRKDGYYYLSVAEGGTELGHLQSMARSRNLLGPYESYPDNPIQTNRNTTNYFQAVGHCDLFQDASQNWWGVALTTRSGPTWDVFPSVTNDSIVYKANSTFPMGREMVLFPVTWKQGEWPVMGRVRGLMSGWPLPPLTRDLPGDGAFVKDQDSIDFALASAIPKHLAYWRTPDPTSYVVSPEGHPNTLQLKSSTANLTASPSFNGSQGLTLIMRRQTDTLFTYSVDISFNPQAVEEEAGVTVFLTQPQHIDLGIVLLPGSGKYQTPRLHFRFRAISENATLPGTTITPVPRDCIPMGSAPAHIVTYGTGQYTGMSSLVSTSNSRHEA